MDTSDYPSLPKLAKMHARLAVDSRRVESLIDAQLDGIGRLLSASEAEDWQAVAHISEYLSKLTPDQENAKVVRTARQLCDELSRTEKAQQTAPKHLGSLLAACRAVRRFWNAS